MIDGLTYQAVRIGDIADWHLVCEISSRGMSATLRHHDPTQQPLSLFDERWQPTDNVLEKIENAVYDHPQVLDDFSSDITVVAPRAIWVPTEMVADDEERAAELYNQVYRAGEEDIMQDAADDATCLYCLVPGLKAFLQRTFPGSRVSSHLASMVRKLRGRIADMPRVYAEIREGEVDIVAFDNRKLLMAATHRWHHPNDIQYHLFNVMNVYGLDPANVQLSLGGERETKNFLLKEMRKTVAYVMLTMY